MPKVRRARSATVEVVVVRTPKGFVVRPAYVVVGVGDRIRWRNYTSDRIQVLLPNRTPGEERLAHDRSYNYTTVIPAGAAAGFHPYAVYSNEARDFCMGESMPGVIIKR